MINSAVVILSRQNLSHSIPYFCMKCSSKLFHVNRDILVVYLGEAYPEKEIPRGMGMVQIKCRGRIRGTGEPCDSVYSFYYQ